MFNSILIIFREDFDNVVSPSNLNNLDADNLTLGAEGKVINDLFIFKY